MRRILALLLAATALVAILSGCGDGDSVASAESPQRIVSLSTVSTEILFAIGAGDQVLAVDSESNHPADAPITDLQSYQPNVEAIAELEPDLVFVSFDPGDVESGLTALGIPVIVHSTGTSLADAYRQIEETGAATGHSSQAAELTADMKAGIAAAVEKAPVFEIPLTYFHEVSTDGWTATSSTFVGQIYALFGLQNIADSVAAGVDFPQLSVEHILNADPDLIFLGDVRYGENVGTVSQRPGWADLTAVINAGVVELDTDVASRWGPRVPELAAAIAEALLQFEPVG